MAARDQADSMAAAVRQLGIHADSDAILTRPAAGTGAAPPRKEVLSPLAAESLALGPRGSSGTPSVSTEGETVSLKGAPEDDETLQRMASACKVLLECLGEDPAREGLVKTPMRMAKALLAITSGYSQDARTIVSDALFESSNEEMVIVKDIECYSMCEHHMLPFFGRVHIGYFPDGRVVGLSKLARLTDAFSKRLQIQERLTQQIAEAVHSCVGARGVAVMVEATHMCMTMRGVEKPGSATISTAYTGCFKDAPEAGSAAVGAGSRAPGTPRELRAEFLAAVRAPSKV